MLPWPVRSRREAAGCLQARKGLEQAQSCQVPWENPRLGEIPALTDERAFLENGFLQGLFWLQQCLRWKETQLRGATDK